MSKPEGPCEVCGEVEIVQEHHINGDHGDNRPQNKIRLCPNDHFKIHHAGYQLVKYTGAWVLIPGFTKSEQRVKEAVAKAGSYGITISEMVRATGLSRPTISHALDRLLQRNMVDVREVGNNYVSLWYPKGKRP